MKSPHPEIDPFIEELYSRSPFKQISKMILNAMYLKFLRRARDEDLPDPMITVNEAFGVVDRSLDYFETVEELEDALLIRYEYDEARKDPYLEYRREELEKEASELGLEVLKERDASKLRRSMEKQESLERKVKELQAERDYLRKKREEELPPTPPKLLDLAKAEVAEIRSLTRGPFRFVILNDGEIRVVSMGKFLSKEELEARPDLLKEAQGYFLEELGTLGIKPPAFELVTVYPLTQINQFTGVDKKLYGPYEAGEAALIPRENAKTFVKEHFASWTMPPEIPPPAVRTYAELVKGFEEKDPWDVLAIFVSRFEAFVRDYRPEDLNRFLRELRERTGTESVYRFYKIYPQLRDDFVSIASRIGWIPPMPPVPAPPKPPRRPPPTRLRPEEVEEVWEQFVAWAKLALIVEPLAYRDRFIETIRTSPTVANAVERARRLVSRITTELKPAPPTAPPAPPFMPVPEDVAEVYRRLGVPPGAPVSEAAFQTVWRTIQRERAVEPPKGLIGSELDYLWREFADFLGRFDMDPERHRPEFEEVLNPDFNLVENLDTVMKKVHELTDGTRWGPEKWR